MSDTSYYIVGEPGQRTFPHKTAFRINGTKKYEGLMTSSTTFSILDTDGQLIAECKAHAWYKSGSTMHFHGLDCPLTFAKKSTRHWTATQGSLKFEFNPYAKTQVFDQLGLELEVCADQIRAYATKADTEALDPRIIVGLLYFIYKQQVYAW